MLRQTAGALRTQDYCKRLFPLGGILQPVSPNPLPGELLAAAVPQKHYFQGYKWAASSKTLLPPTCKHAWRCELN